MCLGVGASSGSKAINNMAGAAYGTAIDQAKTEFGDSSAVFNDLMTSMAPIEKAGPMQTGETAQQASAINAQTINTTAAQFKNAAVAARGAEGAVGGGNIALPSGANLGTETALAEAGAQQESSLLNANTQQNYALGNQNWQFATGALEKAPSMFSTANAATGEATKAGGQALASQDVINAAPSWQKIAMGAIGTVADVGLAASGIGAPIASALSQGIEQATGTNG